MKAEDIARIMSNELGDWNENARISEDGKTIRLVAGNYRECSDDPFAYEYEMTLNDEGEVEEFMVTPQGGNGRNWGCPYEAGLDTLEKIRYACECAEEHNWRNWG